MNTSRIFRKGKFDLAIHHKSSMLDSLAFEPGQQVRCKTRFADEVNGEVAAFDLNSKVLILKSTSASGGSSNKDLHILVLDSVSNVEILAEPPAETTNDLPSIDMKCVKSKQLSALEERLRVVKAIENGVSQEGIALFGSLAKIYGRASDVSWRDKDKILIMNEVLVSAPYKETNCEALATKSEAALSYVKSIVRKFWETLET